MLDPEAQWQAPRRENNGDELRFGARSALREGASVNYEDERDEAISISKEGSDKAQ